MFHFFLVYLGCLIIKNLILMEILYTLLIGAVIGWIAGNLMRGGGFGIIGNIIIGLIGSLIGGWIFGALGIMTEGLIGQILGGVVGAGVLLFIAGLFKK